MVPVFYFAFFWRSVTAGGRVGSFVRRGEPLLRTYELNVSRSIHGKAPKGQLHRHPIAVSGSGHTGS